MLFTLLVSSAFAGCGDLSRATVGTQCTGGGFRIGMSTKHRLSNGRTIPCAEQCEAYLGGQPGCCMQRTNLNWCIVYPGTRKEGIYVQAATTHATQAVVCDPPVYHGHEFTQTVRESNSCPPLFEPIATEADCRRANDALIAGVYYPIGPTHRGWTTRPGGCFLQVTGYGRTNGYVFFNNNPVGGLDETRYNSNDMKICIRSGPTPGAPACALPTGPPTTGARGCAPVASASEGANCLNGNLPYATFFDAWDACELEPECDLVIRWTHWSWSGYRYQMRRSSDRQVPGEGWDYPCH